MANISVTREEQAQYVRVDDLEQSGPFADEYASSGDEAGDAAAAYVHKSTPVSSLEVKARHGFVRKVMGILFAQLVVTFGMVALFCLNDNAKQFLYDSNTGPPLMFSSIAVSLVSLLVLSCVPNMSRRHPHNLILLASFTLGESVMVAAASSSVEPQLLMMAVGLTTGLVLLLMVFAMQTKYDFTGHAVYMVLALYFMLAFGLLMSFSGSNGGQTIYCWLGIVIFSAFLVIDVQMMMGANSKHQFGVDDYVLCAINLYLDIINLLLSYVVHIGAVSM